MHALGAVRGRPPVDAVSDLPARRARRASVSVEDADAGSTTSRPMFGEPGIARTRGWRRARLRRPVRRRRGHLGGGGAAARTGPTTALEASHPVADQDWVRLSQSQFGPIAIGRASGSCRAGRPPPSARQVIRLDPGLAFGTGTHPTTRMCLRWIARQARRRPRWRARARLRLRLGHPGDRRGAAWRARRSMRSTSTRRRSRPTRANAAANGVRAARGLPEHDAEAATTLVLANILATPLKLLAPLLSSHVAPAAAGAFRHLERQATSCRQPTRRGWRCKSPTRTTAGS